MRRTQLYKALGAFLLAVAMFVGTLAISPLEAQAASKPLTPEAAAYEIDRAGSPGEIRTKLKEKTRSYNGQEDNIENSKVAPENVAEGTKNSFKQAADNVRDSLQSDESLLDRAESFLNHLKGRGSDTAN